MVWHPILNRRPRKGDYVICKLDGVSLDENNFLSSHIGKIIKIEEDDTSTWYDVKYDDKQLPLQIIEISGLKYWSHNKKELEDILINKKYNI